MINLKILSLYYKLWYYKVKYLVSWLNKFRNSCLGYSSIKEKYIIPDVVEKQYGLVLIYGNNQKLKKY